jgi:hypothetical protein
MKLLCIMVDWRVLLRLIVDRSSHNVVAFGVPAVFQDGELKGIKPLIVGSQRVDVKLDELQ